MPANPTITLNGTQHPLDGPLTVAELLASLGFAHKPVVVELDGQALAPSDHPTASVAPGAKVELVTLAAGG